MPMIYSLPTLSLTDLLVLLTMSFLPSAMVPLNQHLLILMTTPLGNKLWPLMNGNTGLLVAMMNSKALRTCKSLFWFLAPTSHVANNSSRASLSASANLTKLARSSTTKSSTWSRVSLNVTALTMTNNHPHCTPWIVPFDSAFCHNTWLGCVPIWHQDCIPTQYTSWGWNHVHGATTWFCFPRKGGVGYEVDEEYLQDGTDKSHLESNIHNTVSQWGSKHLDCEWYIYHQISPTGTVIFTVYVDDIVTCYD